MDMGTLIVDNPFEEARLRPGYLGFAQPQAATAAVSCQGVTKEFGTNGTKTLALRGVDVDVFDGQLTLLVGPSGCGKTTLISIVAGLLNPTLGSVAVLGTDLSKLSPRRL